MSKKIQDKIVSKTVPDNSVSTIDNEAAMNATVMSTVHWKNKIDVTLIPASYPFS